MNEQDWAWPRLIDSLQRDIERLRDVVEQQSRDALAVREAHRKELDALIDQLKQLQNTLAPIVKDRDDRAKLMKETRWKWIERSGWVVMGGIALTIWEWLKSHMH